MQHLVVGFGTQRFSLVHLPDIAVRRYGDGADELPSGERLLQMLRQARGQSGIVPGLRRLLLAARAEAAGLPQWSDDAVLLAVAEAVQRGQLHLSQADADGWCRRVLQLDLRVAANTGALWSGLDPERAAKLARSKGVTTLEMTPGGARLDHGDLAGLLRADFGPLWGSDKKRIWRVASEHFARQLRGRVCLFANASTLFPRGTGEAQDNLKKLMWDELMELDMMCALEGQGAVTSVLVYLVSDQGLVLGQQVIHGAGSA